MNYLKLIIVGIAGIVLGTYLGRKYKTGKEDKSFDASAAPGASSVQEKESLVEKQAREKEENKRKILEFFNGAQNKRAANNDIENLLGVSDATATRYLDELEKEGRIRQVGKTGRYVYYEKVGQ
jgi:Fic family protein